jgi:membrane protease YdiL (CAAX protease family)
VSEHPARPESTRQSVLARYPLVCFFVMAYAFTWIVISPWTLGATGAGLLPVDLAGPAVGLLLAAGILAGPTLAAIIMTAVTEGRPGVHRLLGRLVLWRVALRWYLLALLGVPLIMLLGFLAYAMAPPDLGALGGPAYALTYLLGFVLTMILGGPLLEEIGWRGFALPRLQRRYGPLAASLILGVLWAFWHLPQFLVPAWAASSGGGGISGIVVFVRAGGGLQRRTQLGVQQHAREPAHRGAGAHVHRCVLHHDGNRLPGRRSQRVADDHRVRRRGRGTDRGDPRQAELQPTARRAAHTALGARTPCLSGPSWPARNGGSARGPSGEIDEPDPCRSTARLAGRFGPGEPALCPRRRRFPSRSPTPRVDGRRHRPGI